MHFYNEKNSNETPPVYMENEGISELMWGCGMEAPKIHVPFKPLAFSKYMYNDDYVPQRQIETGHFNHIALICSYLLVN